MDGRAGATRSGPGSLPEPGREGGREDLELALTEGELTIVGRLPWSSNATFLARCTTGDTDTLAVYKPGRGERHLWDFPGDLYRREVAAYALSEALGWDLVPVTVERDDGPFGRGSLQRFVPADFDEHYFTLLERGTHHEALRAICAFDIVANNADRKGGHCLLGTDGRIWAIDHGVCFHAEVKLRTVIWDFEGEQVPERLLDDLRRLVRTGLPEAFRRLLDDEEIEAVLTRAAALADDGTFPAPVPGPSGYPPYPWPMI